MKAVKEKKITSENEVIQPNEVIEPVGSTEKCISVTEWLEQKQATINDKEQELFTQCAELGYADITSLAQLAVLEPDTEQDAAAIESFLKIQADAKELLVHKNHFATVIPIEPAKLHITIEIAEKVLAENSEYEIYQKDGTLVRILRQPTHSSTNTLEETITISQIDPLNLTVLMTKIGRFLKFDGRAKKVIPVDCTDKVAQVLVGKKEWQHIKKLQGIIDIPTLRANGTILDTPGYDEETGLLFIKNEDCIVPKVSENPTQEEIEKAKSIVKDPFYEFSFESLADESAAYAMVITGLLRHIFPIAPMAVITATKRGTGKTYLAEQIALIVTGKELIVLPPAKDNDEEKKRLFALLLEGNRIICYDNVEQSFGSSALCAAITGKVYKDRVLGFSANKMVSTKALFMITGNNTSLKGDMATRAVQSKLNTNLEYPEKRSFEKKDLSKYTLQNRGSIVWAYLTLVKGYLAAGMPEQNVQSRFKDWSSIVQSTLTWCGFEDPCANYQAIIDFDPIQNALVEIFSALYALFGESPFQVSEIVSITKKQVKNTSEDQLTGALYELVGVNINTSKLGAYLRSHKDDIREGLKLTSDGRVQGITLWKVIKTNQ